MKLTSPSRFCNASSFEVKEESEKNPKPFSDEIRRIFSHMHFSGGRIFLHFNATLFKGVHFSVSKILKKVIFLSGPEFFPLATEK